MAGFFEVGICIHVEAWEKESFFFIMALYFKLYLYKCEADPLRKGSGNVF